MTETHPTLAFIGAGNMAGSIIGGLVANGYPAGKITASDLNKDALAQLSRDTGITAATSNADAVANAQVVVLAVKPQVLRQVCEPLAALIAEEVLVVSIAAGINSQSLHNWLGASLKRAIVRCMPNTPALVQAGTSGLFATQHVSDVQRRQAEEILAAVGSVCWVESEAEIDSVTAVSGSGPAYFFLMIEAMIDAGIKQGLSRATASTLAIDTAFGAAKLAKHSDVDVAELRKRVTSPNGTTAEAIASFEKNQFRQIVDQAMTACADRSRELAEQLGN